MKQEDKELLLKDLCARLPYGVKVKFKFEPDKGEEFESYGILESINNYSMVEIDSGKLCGQLLSLEYNEIKSYLFPLSSMTNEQKKELKSEVCPDGTGCFNEESLICPVNHTGDSIPFEFMSKIIDWLNKNHFDYRGLIEKGLAIDATHLNIY